MDEQRIEIPQPGGGPDVDKPIPAVYAAIDNDLARDNLENDIPAADLSERELSLLKPRRSDL